MTKDSSSMSTALSCNSASAPHQLHSEPVCNRPHQPILDEIQNLLEALTGVRTREAKKLEVRFSRAVSLYFKRLARKFPYSSLTSYVNQYKRLQEGKKEDAEKLLGRAVEKGSEDLRTTLESGATKGYELGGKQAAQAVRIEPTFKLVDEGAQKWIRKRAAAEVTNINKVTRNRLARVLIDGVDKGESVAKISKNIREQITGWTDTFKGRSKLIATTELNESMSESSLRTYERLDITHKSWTTVGDDDVSEECLDNEAAGVIPIDASFPGGMDRPPQHPGCRCSLTPETK